jgi:hypothetical protein
VIGRAFRAVRRFFRFLTTLLAGLALGSLLASLRRRPQSPAVDQVETGPGEV